MKRILSIMVVASVLLILNPTHAYACGFFDWGCYYNHKENLANIDKAKAEDVARISADAQARIAEGNRQLEQARIQGQITLAQAQAMAAAFKAEVESKRDEQIAAITQNANVAIAGIHETGQTEREKASWDGKGNITTVVVVGLIVAYFIKRRTRSTAQETAIMLVDMLTNQHRLGSGQDVHYLPRKRYEIVDQGGNYENK